MQENPLQTPAPAKKDSRRGAILVLAALCCLAIVPMVGLIIDGSSAYMMRAEISTALDAAVVAGARSLNTGADVVAQAANAQTIATTVFNANIASMNGHMRNVSFVPSSPVPVAGIYYRTVTATASADLPLSMMGLVGFSTTHISMTATAQRRDVNVMLVLDDSGSMSGVLPAMLTDATDFVKMFASGRDNLGLVVFAGAPFVAYAPKTSFLTDAPSVPTLIGQVTSYNGGTNTSQAIWAAYQQLKTLNKPSALNVIVVFTDGLANTFTANFTGLVKASAGCNNLVSPLNGVINAYIDNSGIVGLSDPTAQFLNDNTQVRSAPNSNGCANIAHTSGIGNYLTALPAADVSGNSTNGTGSISAYAPVNLNQLTAANVTNSGLNAFDDAANRIRSDTTFNPLIYTIGLGNNPGLPPDQVLLKRVANDPTYASYNSSQPVGLSVFSPTIVELHSAFLRIASEVLRLSH